MKKLTTAVSALAVTAALVGTYAATAGTASAAGEQQQPTSQRHDHTTKPIDVDILAPGRGDNVGVSGAGWFVDLELHFHRIPLEDTGFTAAQLTGPAGHNNVPPFAGTFSTGVDDRLPGLVVLASTTNSTLPGFSGPGTNLANLFNLTGVTDRSRHAVTLHDDWIVGAPIAGQNVDSTLTVAVIKDLNHDGIYNDAPATVTDQNGDGRIDRRDVAAIGAASTIETVHFRINGDPA